MQGPRHPWNVQPHQRDAEPCLKKEIPRRRHSRSHSEQYQHKQGRKAEIVQDTREGPGLPSVEGARVSDPLMIQGSEQVWRQSSHPSNHQKRSTSEAARPFMSMNDQKGKAAS